MALKHEGINLSVNLNKVALVRNSRTDNNPNIETFARICVAAGAQGLTAHPRPDQRHIRPSDIGILSKVARETGVEFNIEGNPFSPALNDYSGLLALVEQTLPEQCTLVPDSEDQLTSDHGFDLHKSGDQLLPILAELKKMGVRISLFMDPDLEQIRLAKQLGADRIELYTGPFAAAYAKSQAEGKAVFAQHCAAAELARDIGLGVNAGHDLNLENMSMYKQLPGLQEVSIGHALTADALKMGFDLAVKAYLKVCN